MGFLIRRWLDEALSAFARIVLRIFFREVEVIGSERIPRGTPLVLVANHVNSLVDPLLILAFVRVRPRVLAKSTLWSHPVMAPLMVLAGAVPVYRRQDAGSRMSRNDDTFAKCHAALFRGGTVALFPEGTSHNEPQGLPLKTGAARIVLEAEAKYPGLGVRIVPVGLTYEGKDRFRSHALVQIGEPIDPAREVADSAADGAGAVRALTDRIARGLADVTLSYASWEEAHLVDRAVSLFGDELSREPNSSPYTRFSLRKTFTVGYRALKARRPDQVDAAVAAVSRFDHQLRVLSLSDAQMAAPGVASAQPRRRLRAVARLALGLPVVVVGTVLNWLPYRFPGWIARRLSKRADEPATFKLLAGLIAFPLAWALEAAAVAVWGGVTWGVVVAVAAPASGYAALLLVEAWGRLDEQGAPGLGEQLRQWVIRDVRREREELRRRIAQLVTEYRTTTQGSTDEAPASESPISY